VDARPILDQTTDLGGQEQYRLCRLFGAPDYVKQASSERLCGTDGLRSHLFADQRRRCYPMHNKSACWLSSAFFFDKRAALPRHEAEEIERRLEESARFWGIEAQVEGLKKRAAELARDDLAGRPDSDFAWVQGRERHLPLRNGLEVRAAAEYLHKWRDEFAFADRQRMARAVLQKAARFGAALGAHDEFLERLAGFGSCPATEAAQLVRDRAKLARARDAEVAGELEKMAEMIVRDPRRARQPRTLAKVAETIDQLDRMLHIRDYSEAIPRAEDVLFRITRKTAEALANQHVSTVGGSVYDRDDLSRLRTKAVRDYLGDGLADAVDGDGLHVDGVKLAEIVATLPLGDARVFDQLCKDMGIRPFAKEAGVRQGFSVADLRTLAAAHKPGAKP
jgi:hypothetical protein